MTVTSTGTKSRRKKFRKSSYANIPILNKSCPHVVSLSKKIKNILSSDEDLTVKAYGRSRENTYLDEPVDD